MTRTFPLVSAVLALFVVPGHADSALDSLARDVSRTVHPYDDYQLARTLVDSTLPEDDLFAGIRQPVYDPGARS